MRLTKKILVSGASDVIITIVGFLGTLYFARALGAGAIGTYTLGMAVINIVLLFDFGVSTATVKRISEEEEPAAYFTLNVIVFTVLLVVVLLGMYLLSPQINDYVGGAFAWFLAVIFFFKRIYQILGVGLRGQRQVHVLDSADAVERILRVAVQALLIYVGVQTVALFAGYVTSLALITVAVVGYYVSRIDLGLTIPSREHVLRTWTFARYSWLNGLKSQSLAWIDVTVLGFFVLNAEVGIYQVAWTLSMTFQILSKAISRNVFPEISKCFAKGDIPRAEQLAEESLSYASLIPLPAIGGAYLLGDRVLQVYGRTFVQGADVLVLLTIAALVLTYESVLQVVANGIDRPWITFRANLVFIGVNVILNILLISMYGLPGAAVATGIALFVSTATTWVGLREELSVSLPISEVGYQAVSTVLMGLLVFAVEPFFAPLSIPELLLVVIIGAGAYFTVLYLLPTVFQTKLRSIVYG